MTCPYCGQPAKYLASSASVYNGRDYGPVWICRPCDAWCGCHKGTQQPLGRLANAELRHERKLAHQAFDRIWKSGRMRRADAYRLLAESLQISGHDCHIGVFDVADCRRVGEVVAAVEGGAA